MKLDYLLGAYFVVPGHPFHVRPVFAAIDNGDFQCFGFRDFDSLDLLLEILHPVFYHDKVKLERVINDEEGSVRRDNFNKAFHGTFHKNDVEFPHSSIHLRTDLISQFDE
jgi:hypothetical protein